MPHLHRFLACFLLVCAPWFPAAADEPDPQRGYAYLLNKAYLPPDFDQETFDAVWKVWPTALRARAASATVEQRRRMAYRRYGLTERPDDDSGQPLQYVVGKDKNWTMNCLACHGGLLNGRPVPGLPNAQYDLQTLTEEIRLAKLLLGKPMARMDVGSLVMPLSTNRGTTNAVMFGVALMAYRDPDLQVRTDRPPPRMIHHDMDPPPWWHFRKRSHMYIDGFAQKGPRGLMQFMLVKENGPDDFHRWETDFQHVYAFLESLRPPRYPFEIDTTLARHGERIFGRHCAECHGTYGPDGSYPQRRVPLEQIGTDPVRLRALSASHRQAYAESWFAHFGQHDTLVAPDGYVAPPLDGVWATAPYFHNGSVPTLWHVLHPQDRPQVWTRRSEDYDTQRLGLSVEGFTELPPAVQSKQQRRQYVDTGRFGKSAAGHTFPDALRAAEKQAVLEYLKTL